MKRILFARRREAIDVDRRSHVPGSRHGRAVRHGVHPRQKVGRCVQLEELPRDLMFRGDYPFRSSGSRRMSQHFAGVAHELIRTELVGLEDLLRRADVVSLHCPLTADNRGLMNAERLRLMKPSAFLINTARGPLIVEQDLANALNAGTLAGAALDVLPVEPPVNGSPLMQAKNCIVTPHIAWATKEARARLMNTAVENLRAFIGGKPQNVVN